MGNQMDKDMETPVEDMNEVSAEEVLEEEAAAAEESDASEGDAEPEEAAEGGEIKRGLFGKKKDKKDKKDQQIEELNDRLKRNLAEFDNFRKRTEKEKSAMYEIGAKDIIEKILPVLDNFERGLSTISDEDRGSAFADGMDMIYKQFVKTLADIGVEPIEAVGAEFNPDLHNAVMHVEEEDAGENVVVEEFQKGYTYRGTVIRYSMVKVAN